jgi:hypothetical protein
MEGKQGELRESKPKLFPASLVLILRAQSFIFLYIALEISLFLCQCNAFSEA